MPAFAAPAAAFEAPTAFAAPVALATPPAAPVEPAPIEPAPVEAPAAAAAAPGVPVSVPYTWEDESHSNRLGVVAFVAGLILLVASIALAVYNGLAFGPYISLDGDTAQMSEQFLADGRTDVVLSMLGHVGLGTLLGIWIIVQSIIAIARRRGRGFGIAGLILAIVAPVLSYVAYVVAAGYAAASTL